MLTRQSSKRSSSEDEPAAPPPLSSGLTRIFDDGMQVSKKPKTGGINDAKQSARWANRRAEIRAKRDANKAATTQGAPVANKAAATQGEGTVAPGLFSTIRVSSSGDAEQSKDVSQPGPSGDPPTAAYSDDTQPAFVQTMDDVMNLRVDKLAKHLMGGKAKK